MGYVNCLQGYSGRMQIGSQFYSLKSFKKSLKKLKKNGMAKLFKKKKDLEKMEKEHNLLGSKSVGKIIKKFA